MARITDSTGTDWALMAVKDAAGRVYIRAYRNAWDAQKKRSNVKAKFRWGVSLTTAVFVFRSASSSVALPMPRAMVLG